MRKLIAIALCVWLPSSVFAEPQTSAVRNSFSDVTSHLEPGGNLYLYLSTEEWFTSLSTQLAQMRDFVNSVPATSAADKRDADRLFTVLGNLVRDSGIEEISGFGMSSVAVEKGLFRSKAILHHYRGKNTGYLWSMFGKQPHTLDGLNLLPANTAFASFSDIDISRLWAVITKEIEQSGIPGARQAVQPVRDQFSRMTGADLDKALASVDGECGIVFTLDESKGNSVFLPLRIPEAGLMLLCKVKDDSIFDAFDTAWKTNPLVIQTNRAGLRMRTMRSSSPQPITIRPSIARSENLLFIASNDALVEAALAVKAGTQPGLKSTDEFKHLSQRVPLQANSFTFRSGRLADTMARLQSEMLAGNASAQSLAQAPFLASIFGTPGSAGTFSVAANTEEGWLVTGNSGQNPANALLIFPTVFATLMIATVAIPSLLRSRQAANESAAVARLRTIATAQMTYAAMAKGNYGSMQNLVAAGLLDARFLSEYDGYTYAITASARTYTATATPLSANSGRFGYVVRTDGVVRYSVDPALAPQGQQGQQTVSNWPSPT
jgi:type II secretory pathway pseudopilin PulG